MNSVLVRAIAALLLVGAAWMCWKAGQLERRLADADRQLATLRYEAPVGEYDGIEKSIGLANRLPWTTQDLVKVVREHRATAHYWGADYSEFALHRDAGGVLVERDPEMLWLTVNAAYRTSQREAGDRQSWVRALDAVMAGYADLLKNSPGHADAAYNYEYVARVRDAAARGRPVAREVGPFVAGDLPAGKTLHGPPGGPPPDTDMKRFKMLIPLRPEERDDLPKKAGAGEKKPRKG